MPSTEAHVATDRPSRYLVQLCKHFARKGRHLGHRPRAHLGEDTQTLQAMREVAEQARVDWSETEGNVSLPWGTIALHSAPGALVLRVQAPSEENLRRLQDLVTGHLERFGRRDGLQVSWQPGPHAEPDGSGTADVAGTSAEPTSGRSRHLKLLGLAAVVLVLAAHFGLASVLAANWSWTGGAVGALLALLVLKTAVLGGFAAHRRATKRR
ncbi:DUF2218 domain-containing protein [Streptomyces sp. Tu 3180]|uniref:DUF2218 domain-containing protein n=1 Tax=Streptomyces sp. Tu 3180 TaxID=2682611 RepID=UPI00135A2050|nr:DUF2218 domain-containing protein [Streptomyces sp. Tu 3180]KAF3463204.1 DUF2218 domain-containing protein [Streptomyces sp. Tu 3180]